LDPARLRGIEGCNPLAVGAAEALQRFMGEEIKYPELTDDQSVKSHTFAPGWACL
jgi:hypothetical protein